VLQGLNNAGDLNPVDLHLGGDIDLALAVDQATDDLAQLRRGTVFWTCAPTDWLGICRRRETKLSLAFRVSGTTTS
jgi:hypothetical protein